ncbi:hypothetical protein [Planococcus salinarum]|uniref:hypothetical protein n=1 Tax=Planococcus salinarum TaxID=622695 RepID=UPI000E3D227B|nr:hypothetical protein [Planococcus salinarum]TAA70667.1 hypothetical protein D2909_10530 [Planococcus salinarum]
MSSIWAKEGWYSLGEKGISWAETMLSLMIIFMLFGTLLPLMQKMQQTLDDKQMQATAYETMHEAARTILATGSSSGRRAVNGTIYTWEFNSELCVSYNNYRFMPVTVCAE